MCRRFVPHSAESTVSTDTWPDANVYLDTNTHSGCGRTEMHGCFSVQTCRIQNDLEKPEVGPKLRRIHLAGWPWLPQFERDTRSETGQVRVVKTDRMCTCALWGRGVQPK